MTRSFLLTVALCFATAPSFAATLVTGVNVNAADPAGLEPTIEDFRTALGANNGNNPVNADPNGRRQINWDAAPDFISDPNEFPGDFFNGDANPRARGIEFEATGDTTGFQLSSTAASGEPVAFGFEEHFVPFSPERMFTPVGGNTFKVNFFDPADQVTPALSRGLGVVFNDVEVAGATTMTLYDSVGEVLAEESVLAGDKGSLSFLGFIFDEAVISFATITVGNAYFDGQGFVGGEDGVVMDDFIFGEPVPANVVPLPASLAFLLVGVGALGLGAGRKASRKS